MTHTMIQIKKLDPNNSGDNPLFLLKDREVFFFALLTTSYTIGII